MDKICICFSLFILLINTSAYSNHPPNNPLNPYPEDGSINVPIRTNLSCFVYDVDNDTMNVRFYWINTINESEVGIHNLTNYTFEGNLIGIDYGVDSESIASITLPRLEYNTTYYWYAVANDGMNESISPIWKFTTTINHPPVLNVSGISSGYTGKKYNFYISSIDNDGDKIKYGFDWNGDRSIDEWTDYHASGEKIKISHCWLKSGTYSIIIIAKDEGGLNSSYKKEINIDYNHPPHCSIEASGNYGSPPLNITFYISSYDEDGSIVSWNLDVNKDGTPEYGGEGAPPPEIWHVYRENGNFTAILRVVDNAGSVAYAEINIRVGSPPEIVDVFPKKIYAGERVNITLKGENFTNKTQFFIDSPHVKIMHIWFVDNETVEIEVKLDEKVEGKANITAINPDGEKFTLENAFVIKSKKNELIPGYILAAVIAISSVIFIWYFFPFKRKCYLHIENEMPSMKSGDIALLPINQVRGKGKRLIVKIKGIPNKKVRLTIDSKEGEIVEIDGIRLERKKRKNDENKPLALFDENKKETIELALNEKGESFVHIVPNREKHQYIKERVGDKIRYRETRDNFGIGIGKINVKAEILDGKKVIARCEKYFILFELIAELKEINLKEDSIKFTRGWKTSSLNQKYWNKWMCELKKFKYGNCKFYGYQFSVLKEDKSEINPSEESVIAGSTGLMYVKYCIHNNFFSFTTRARTPYNGWIHPDITSDEKGHSDVFHGKSIYYFEINSILNSCLFSKASLEGKIFLLTDPPDIWKGEIMDAQIDFYQQARFYLLVEKSGEGIEKNITNRILDVAGFLPAVGEFLSLARKTEEIMEEINKIIDDIKTKNYSSKSLAFCLTQLSGKSGKKYDFAKGETDIVKEEFEEEKEKRKIYKNLLNITETFSHFSPPSYHVNEGVPVLKYSSSLLSTALRSDYKSCAQSWLTTWKPLMSVEDITFKE